MSIHKFNMLYKDLVNTLGTEDAETIFPEYVALPNEMEKRNQIFLASCVMQRMDELLTKDEIVKVRHGHTCNLPKQQKADMLSIWEKSRDIDEFLTSCGGCKQDDGTYVISFQKFHQTTCQCPLFYKVEKYDPISITWCECCNGHVKKSISEICGQEVDTQVVQSISSGGKECLFKIILE